MNRIQLLLFSLIVAMTATAGTYTGIVVDEAEQPFPFANVVLLNPADSTFIGGTTTDGAGSFTITAKQSSAIVKFSYIGYETTCVNATDGDMGTIQLRPVATMLGEVVVKGMRPTYKLTTEGIKTDLEGTLLSRAGDANDVLGNLPGVQKKDKDIEVFGKGTPLIYVNGRLLRNTSELEQIKSENIQSVELITNPGAKYKADVEAVILIKTKRPHGEGFSFDTRASYYQSKRPDVSIGTNWNYRHGGLDVFGTVWFNDDRWMQDDYISMDVQADTLWRLDQYVKGKSHANAIYNSVGVNYVFNDHHSAGVRYDTKWHLTDHAHGSLTADVVANGEYYDHIVNSIHNENKANMPHTLNAYYNGRLGKTAIDFNLDYIFSKQRQDQFNDEVSQERDSRVVTAQSTARNQLLAGKLVLSWPLWGGNLSAGSEMTGTRRNDDYTNPEQVVPSSVTEQQERGYAFFVEYARPLPFGGLRLGLRNENVCNEYYNMGVKIDEQSRTYHHFFPSVGLTARAGNVQLMINYAAKIQRPYYWQLNGSVTYANRFTWESGNPLLKPSIINQLSVMAMYRWMTLMIDYKHTSDAAVNVARAVPGSETTTLLTRENVNHDNKMRVMLNFNPKFGIYEPQLSLGMIKDWIKIPTPIGTVSPSRPIFMIGLNNSIRLLPTLTATANVQVITKGDQENMSLVKATARADLSLTKTFMHDRLSLKVAGHNIFNAQEHITMTYGMRNMYKASNNDSRQLEVTVRYKFNTAQSKYRGTGAGSEEKARLGK